MRVGWTAADEDRHEVDRGAIERALSVAADVQLEGRIVPVMRTRAPGISQLVSRADKVRDWAKATDVHAPPLLECLERVTTTEPEDIVAEALAPHPDEVSAADAFARDRWCSDSGRFACAEHAR